MQIENYRAGTHPVIASFDVYFGDKSTMRLRNLKLVMSKKGTPFVSFPSFQQEENGVKKWVQYISFSKEKEMEFREEVMELLKPFAGNAIAPAQESNESYF